MRVDVNLIATFKMLAGKSHIPLDLDSGQTVSDAFHKVLKLAPVLKPHWLDHDGHPHVYVHVFLNGDDASTLVDGLETRLNEGDVLDFIPPVAGG
jgi:MoaD family protein